MSRLNQIKAFLEADSSDPFLHFALAKEYEKMGDAPQALATYQALQEQFPDYVGTYYHLGKILEESGQLEKALDIYQKGMDVAKAAGDQHSFSELAGAKMNAEI